ncbi:DUF1282 family protein [Vibrio sp. Y2-5]|uniref:YIP1 family protein n=1 Tax=Vibrio sp. Y2-5 TaxID=2743977 RepID=UPI00166185BA|nr:YIP1 family protein [Vibrio sp. Y2-5]MBD0784935.1 DUF1282 family protein [Vibrio sp. Y2-5]
MNPSSNPLIMLVDIFRSPQDCFAALYERSAWGWQPFIVLLITPFLFWGAYFANVDFEWLKTGLSAQMEATNPDLIHLLEADTLLASEIISDVMSRTLTIILLALWFNLATRQGSAKLGFWKWFAASSVVIFPAVIGDLASYASMLLKHGQVMSYAADLNSLNGLIKLPLTNPWSPFTSSFPLLLPWYIFLGYAAVITWTRIERAQAIVIATLPWVAYYGIWAITIAIS